MAHSNLTSLEPLYFESSGRIVKLLGRESISNPNIAILEIIKNAWDADATLVEVTFEDLLSGKDKLTIRDNGDGMTMAEIRDNWMVAATDVKEKFPMTRKYGRPKIGKKGIARFALENLSEHLVLISKPRGESRGYQMTLDWTKYEHPGAKFEKIPNVFYSFAKRKDEHSLEYTLSPLREKWDLDKLYKLAVDIESILPSVSKPSHFDVKLIAPEFPQVSSVSLESKFLKKAVYISQSKLEEDGTIVHDFYVGGRRKHLKRKDLTYTCGPLFFRFYYFFRLLDKYEAAKKTGIYRGKSDFNMNDLKKFLDEWAGIKVYRDGFRVKPYGDSGNDWLGLDKLRVDQPSIYPENEDVLGFIQISRTGNPQLMDTTTREGLINNKAFQDMLRFAQSSIRFFAMERRAIKEEELGGKVKRRKRKRRTMKGAITRKPLLEFGAKYPDPFSRRLEEEINDAYGYGLPNATLMLSRKVVENLVYNILQTKFGENQPEMWWDEKKKRPLGLGPLLGNLSVARDKFKHDQPHLIRRFLELVNPFLREANRKAHYIIEYLDSVEELEKLKIPEMVQLLLTVRSRL